MCLFCAYSLMFREYEKYLNNFKIILRKQNPNFYLIGRTGLYFPYTIEGTIKSTLIPNSSVK